MREWDDAPHGGRDDELIPPFSPEAIAAMDARDALYRKHAGLGIVDWWPSQDRAELERLNAILATEDRRRARVRTRMRKRLAAGKQWAE